MLENDIILKDYNTEQGLIIFDFDLNVSVNNIYKFNVKNKKMYSVYKSRVYNKFRGIELVFKKCDCYLCEYSFIFMNNNKRDISNYLKFFEDLIFRLFIKDDDSKVYKIIVNKFVDNSLDRHRLIFSYRCLEK